MRKLILTALGVLLSMCNFAQTTPNRKVIKYSLKDGLSFGFVNSIIQDNKGFMWFATADGLNRFDGINFKVYKYDPTKPEGLPGNYLEMMFKDPQEEIWVSTRRGLFKFNTSTEQFTPFYLTGNPADRINSVNHISVADKNTLWFSCNNLGMFSYNKNTRQIKEFSKRNVPAMSNNSISMSLQDSHGLLWLAEQGGTLSVYHVKSGVILSKATEVDASRVKAGRLNAICEDHNQNVWIGTSQGLAYYVRNENKFYLINGPKHHLRSNYFYSLLEDSQKNLLIGLQDGGLYKLDLQELQKTTPEKIGIEPVRSEDNYNITERTIQSLYQDKDNNVWAGTYGDGIYMVSSVPEKFMKFQTKQTSGYSTSLLRYYGMCLDADGLLWLGSDGDGIYKKNLNGDVLKHYYADGKNGSLTNNAILCAAKDNANNLWFGSYEQGLFRYDKPTDKFINFTHSGGNPASLCSNDVRVIYPDSHNSLWIGTNGGGISRMAGNGNTFINYNNGNSSLGSNNIRAICEDNDGNLFIGTYGSGLWYYDRVKDKFSNISADKQMAEYLPSRVIYSLKMYPGNKLLIGTEDDGLLFFDIKTKSLSRITEANGLANNTINAIQPDEDYNIWASTNKGISKIDVNGKIVNYDASNGLQTGHFSPNAVMYSLKDKFICFGGTEGYNIFFPQQVKTSSFKPNIVITALQLFGKEVEVGKKDNILTEVVADARQITLKPDQSVFSIQYAALNYAYTDKSEFAYQLEGLDKSWNYVKNQKSATYRYLNPGTYNFKVKAANQDGVWFDNYTSLKIVILPPWYKTWWAYLCYFVIGAVLVYYYLRYKSNQARLKYEIRIANISAEKEKELVEKKLSFFTNISHEFRTPLTLIINPVKEMIANNNDETDNINNLHLIYRNSRRLLSLVDHLLLFRKADTDGDKLKVVKLNFVNLCREVFLCFSFQAKTKNINFNLECSLETIELYADREKMEIVLFNLLSNAIKFTPKGGSVCCTLTEDEKGVNLYIKDSGAGIPPGTGDQLFDRFYQVQDAAQSQPGFGIGLYLVKMFINSHKGAISYESKPGDGTTFKIELLKGKEHFGSAFVFEDVVETSVFLDELMDFNEPETVVLESINTVKVNTYDTLLAAKNTMLIIEDNLQIRQYVKQIFQAEFEVFEADNGLDGFEMASKLIPSIIICDVMMDGISGIELCSRVKEDVALNNIPVILLTASTLPEIRLKGIEGGADDYITKPFEKEVLIARVHGLLRNKENLHKYFYNEITFKTNDFKISADYKEFLEKCIKIVEEHLEDRDFCIKDVADRIGMSHSNFYKKIKCISGSSANEFIRFVRLRKSAELMITTDCSVAEAAYKVGINDKKYFREKFSKLFGLNPSDYIKKFRQPYHNQNVRSIANSRRNS
ncbi:hybrid sensor histidine kinase/response regulator transcription factor [Mucilaginibacter terrenus]|nr:two-component regulator propeller domain-containing protein [Mucilaginibacter terrenus]